MSDSDLGGLGGSDRAGGCRKLSAMPFPVRIESISAEWSAQMCRKTLVDWMRIAADWAETIYKLIIEELRRGALYAMRQDRGELCRSRPE